MLIPPTIMRVGGNKLRIADLHRHTIRRVKNQPRRFLSGSQENLLHPVHTSFMLKTSPGMEIPFRRSFCRKLNQINSDDKRRKIDIHTPAASLHSEMRQVRGSEIRVDDVSGSDRSNLCRGRDHLRRIEIRYPHRCVADLSFAVDRQGVMMRCVAAVTWSRTVDEDRLPAGNQKRAIGRIGMPVASEFPVLVTTTSELRAGAHSKERRTTFFYTADEHLSAILKMNDPSSRLNRRNRWIIKEILVHTATRRNVPEIDPRSGKISKGRPQPLCLPPTCL